MISESASEVDSFFVLLKSSQKLSEFVIGIEDEFKDKVEIEFVGGHYDVIIMHCSLNVFSESLVQSFVECFFSLPLLARIEHSIFDQSVLSYFHNA